MQSLKLSLASPISKCEITGKRRISTSGFLAKLNDSPASFQSMAILLSHENSILQQLLFPSVHERENSIWDAESGTFAWMVETESVADLKGRIAVSMEEDLANLHDEQSAFPSANTKDSVQGSESEESQGGIFASFTNSGGFRDGEDDIQSEDKDSDKAMKERTREQFLAWLGSGQHILHISGKVGSGKSTLMKYLGKNSRVHAQLHHWAAEKQLVFAQFFFWS